MTQRRRAREGAFEVLYRYDIGNEDIKKASNEVLTTHKFSPAVKEFFLKLVNETYRNLANIDKTIEANLQHWSLSRLVSVDRAILRIACAELLYFDDIPPKVTINEALEIAKKFGGEDSPRFINGVLDAIYKKTKKVEKK